MNSDDKRRLAVLEAMLAPIKIECFTNLDDYHREKWAASLPAVPSIGQWMKAESGKVLKIVNLTWRHDGTLRVELHKA